MEKKDLRLERKKLRWKENKLSILESAERVFAQKGYSLATMNEIAEEAQFSKATLYHYFQSKRDMFFEIILSSFETVLQRMKRIQGKNETAEQMIKEITHFVLQFFQAKKNISRIFLMERSLMKTVLNLSPEEQVTLSPAEKEYLEGIIERKERIMQIVIEILERGIKAGELRRMDAHDAAHAYEAMLHGFYFTKFWYEQEYNLETGAELIHDFFLHGVKKDKNV